MGLKQLALIVKRLDKDDFRSDGVLAFFIFLNGKLFQD